MDIRGRVRVFVQARDSKGQGAPAHLQTARLRPWCRRSSLPWANASRETPRVGAREHTSHRSGCLARSSTPLVQRAVRGASLKLFSAFSLKTYFRYSKHKSDTTERGRTPSLFGELCTVLPLCHCLPPAFTQLPSLCIPTQPSSLKMGADLSQSGVCAGRDGDKDRAQSLGDEEPMSCFRTESGDGDVTPRHDRARASRQHRDREKSQRDHQHHKQVTPPRDTIVSIMTPRVNQATAVKRQMMQSPRTSSAEQMWRTA